MAITPIIGFEPGVGRQSDLVRVLVWRHVRIIITVVSVTVVYPCALSPFHHSPIIIIISRGL